MNSVYFQNTIDLFSDQNMKINLQNDEIIVNLKRTDVSQKVLSEAAKFLTAYFTEDVEYLSKINDEFYQSLKKRIRCLVERDPNVGHRYKITSLKVKMFKINPNQVAITDEDHQVHDLKSYHRSVRVVLEVKPEPTTREEMIENVHLAINNPGYILSETFAVYDCNIGKPPYGWSKSTIFERLKKQIEIEFSYRDDKSLANVEILKATLELFKPAHLILMSVVVCLDKGPENGAMKQSLLTSLLGGLPTLTTKKLFIEALNDTSGRFAFLVERLLKKECAIYLQKEGDVVLLLPPLVSIEDAGMNPQEFKLFKEHSKEIKRALDSILTGKFDLSNVMMKDSEDQMFHRFVFDTGHGLSSNKNKDHGIIAGLPISKFQESLDVLWDNKMDFALVQSCFLGENTKHIKQPKCPMIITSSTDLSSFLSTASMQQHKGLKLAAKKLYPNIEIRNHKPKQLTQKDLEEIGGKAVTVQAFHNDEKYNGKLQNMQSFILPNPNPNVPHTIYSGFKSSQVMDVDKDFKNLRRLTNTDGIIKIADEDKHRCLYFLSRPIMPAIIRNEVNSGDVGLASRGGNNFHILKGLELPKIEFITLVDQTLKNRSYDPSGIKFDKEMGANKLFVLENLKCLVDGKSFSFDRVVIAGTEKGPFVACQAPDGGYYMLKSREDWDKLNFIPVSEEDFALALYLAVLACTPSIEQLERNTAGQQRIKDYHKHLQGLFSDVKLSVLEDFFEATALTTSRFDLKIDRIFRNFNDSEARQNILFQAALFAIKNDNLAALEDLLNSGVDVNAEDSEKVPLFHHAIKQGNQETIEFFIKSGVTITHRSMSIAFCANHKQIFDLLRNKFKEKAFKKPTVIKPDVILNSKIREPKSLPLPITNEVDAAVFAIKTQNIETLKHLLDNVVDVNAEDADGQLLLHHAVLQGNEKIIKIILKKNVDLLKRNKNHETAFFLAAKNLAIMELLLNKFVNTPRNDFQSEGEIRSFGAYLQ
jgi:ankyrin repeat protein